MTGQIIEIAEDGYHLSSERGFLLVKQGKEVKGRVAYDSILAVIASARQLTYSHTVLQQLSQRGLTFAVCGHDFVPTAILWPVLGQHRQSQIMAAQTAFSEPTRKRLWQALVRSKLEHQAAALDAAGLNSHAVASLIKRVKSGDPDNIEAWAASRYWKRLMGEGFKRDRDAEDVNRLLNYGYIVFRAAMARAVAAAGLHPSMGLHHKSPTNTMPLVDDLMEPFRPLVDLQAWHAEAHGINRLSAGIKKRFVSLLNLELDGKTGESSTIARHMQRLTTSLASIALNEGTELALPKTALALMLRHWMEEHADYS